MCNLLVQGIEKYVITPSALLMQEPVRTSLYREFGIEVVTGLTEKP